MGTYSDAESLPGFEEQQDTTCWTVVAGNLMVVLDKDIMIRGVDKARSNCWRLECNLDFDFDMEAANTCCNYCTAIIMRDLPFYKDDNLF